MNLREGFSSTHHASLKWSPDHERAIDKVAASGLCDSLGVLLWKAKYMLESDAYRVAQRELEVRLKEKFKREANLVCDLLAEQSLREYISDACRVCNGAKEMIVDKRRIVCEVCSGFGIRRYTDFERARAMSLSLGRVKTLERHFGWTINLIQTLDDQVNGALVYFLERNNEKRQTENTVKA